MPVFSSPIKENAMQRNITISLALLLCTMVPAIAQEDDDFIVDTSPIGKSNNGVVNSNQFLELGIQSPNALRLEGEHCLRVGDLDHAIMVLQRSVEMAPLDMDGRILYAQALQKKLMKQKHRDPILYNFIVKQWLFVAKKADFPDQKMQGYNGLYALTGTPIGRFEKDHKYLARVLMPEDGSKKVALGGRKSKENDKDKDKETGKDRDRDREID